MPSSGKPVERLTTAAGCVTLVGAGPGAADLLTLRAVRALQTADAVLYDALVGPEVLALLPASAERIPVGKRCGRASFPQTRINALMIALARAGRQVVRLKCGDPMIFGRGGEEVAALRAAGISVSVVPGISAANAAAASLAVSLTYRGSARTLTFMTGFTREGTVPDVDWSALADPGGTLAVYMGGRVAARIARRLLLAGRPAATPVAIVEAVSQPDECITRATLRDLLVWRTDGDRPILILIGEAIATTAAGAVEDEAERASRRAAGA